MDIRAPLPRSWRTAFALLGWFVLLLGAALALTLALQPDRRDALRQADRLFSAGRYHEALSVLTPLAPALPEAQARLGMLRALRGEHAQAERQLRAAMLRGLGPVEYQRALLYLGRALADSGRHDLAARTWALVEDCRSVEACAYRGPARVLAADEALRRGEYLLAGAGLQAALAGPLPPLWAESARYRLALVRANEDSEAARRDLALAVAPERADPLIAPLLPAVGDGPLRLQAALDAPPAGRPQILGLFYLSLGLYGLAEEQFAQVDPHGPDALGAAAYAAYPAGAPAMPAAASSGCRLWSRRIPTTRGRARSWRSPISRPMPAMPRRRNWTPSRGCGPTIRAWPWPGPVGTPPAGSTTRPVGPIRARWLWPPTPSGAATRSWRRSFTLPPPLNCVRRDYRLPRPPRRRRLGIRRP